ncbi:SCO0607 family lipoprotein [Actinoplanes sp. CA-131856]
MRRFLVVALLLSGVAGCSFEEAICGSGEYPVAAVDSFTGRGCVPDGEPVPEGYVRFPAGKEPRKVGDEWDRYWESHKLDQRGNEIR